MEIKSIINETSDELFYELEHHLLYDKKPSIYLMETFLNSNNDTCYNLINTLCNLKKVKKNSMLDNEEDALTHTLYVIDQAAKYKDLAHNKKAFMFAALLHDIGKTKTTVLNSDDNIIYMYPHHDLVGGEMARRILRTHINNITLRDNIVSLIKYHMTHFSILNRIKTNEVLNMIENTDIHDVALLSLCDRLGEKNLSKEDKETILNDINKFLNIMSSKTGLHYDNFSINF